MFLNDVVVVEAGAAVAVQRGVASLGPVGVEWQAFTVVAGLEIITIRLIFLINLIYWANELTVGTHLHTNLFFPDTLTDDSPFLA